MDEFNNNINENTSTEPESRPTPPPTPPRAPAMNYTQPETPSVPPMPEQPVAYPEPQPEPAQEPQPVPQPAPQEPPFGYRQQGFAYPPQPPYAPRDNRNPYIPQNEQPDYYRITYGVPAPQKQPMSGGQKAFVAIAIAILAAALAAFITFTAMNHDTKSADSQSRDNGGFNFELPTEISTTPQPETDAEIGNGNYPESDAKDKVNKNYTGLSLNKKPEKKDSEKYGAEYAFENVEKSVVGIICYVDGQEGTTSSYTGMGTGIITTSDGYIITNSHIVANSRTAYKIKVVTNDNKEYKAGVVGFDNRTDLAVLKIDAKGLTPAQFGDSAQNKVTEDVIAVGNPRSLAYQNSVTKGIISAIDRETSVSNISKLIQTDAAINPGNSGGPLCNMYGYVIGITSSKIVLDDFEAMAFAIPSQTVKEITDDIIRNGFVGGRVKIGITGRAVYNEEAEIYGIQVETIGEGGPLDGKGVREGDVIVSLDGTKTQTFTDIYNALAKHKAGDEVMLEIYRPDADKTYKVSIKLQADES